MATVTVRPSGETVIDGHFSNGKRDWGGVLQVIVGLFDASGKEIAEVSLATHIRARSLDPRARTRTIDRQTVLNLPAADAARIARVRMVVYRYSAGAPTMIYVKFGDGMIPKGAYPKKPAGLPPYAPNVGFTGVTRLEDMPRYRPPAPVRHVPQQHRVDDPHCTSSGHCVYR
jgi:hypothetical protein